MTEYKVNVQNNQILSILQWKQKKMENKKIQKMEIEQYLCQNREGGKRKKTQKQI